MSPRKKKGKEEKIQHPFSLRAVYLREGKQWMMDGFDPLLAGQPLHAQFRVAGHKVEIQESVQNMPDAEVIKSCRFITTFAFRYLRFTPDTPPKTQEDEQSSLVVEISACIAVDYLIGVPEVPTPEKLEQWAKGNAMLHCWPYWREFCHSTLMRMNLPITVMPLMEVNNQKQD